MRHPFLTSSFKLAKLCIVLLSAQAAFSSVAAQNAAPAAASPVQAQQPVSPCAQFASRLSKKTIAVCEQQNLQDSGARSVEGRSILFEDIIDPQPQTKVLMIGTIHGDELTAAAVNLYWMQLARTIPTHTHWRFIPILNPDGFLKKKAQRMNARGVDLNRNFPTPNWDKESVDYWNNRTKRDPRRFPGNTALSEPESQYVVREMDTFKPDLIVSTHAPFGVLDFDGPTTPPKQIGRLYLDQVGIYPGSLGNYGGVYKGIPIVTIELPNAGSTPAEGEIRQMWVDLLRWKAEHLAKARRSNANSSTNSATNPGSNPGSKAEVLAPKAPSMQQSSAAPSAGQAASPTPKSTSFANQQVEKLRTWWNKNWQ